MSEELLQTAPKPLGRYLFYRLGSSTLRQLRNAGVVKGSFTQNIANKKPDGVVVLLGGGVKAIVEYKSPSELRTPEQVQVAIDQELAVARQLCKLLIVTSGNTTVGNQQKWDTFVKERSRGCGSVAGLPEQVVVAFAAG